MNTPDRDTHHAAIVEQFSRQAIPFTQVPGHLDSIQLLAELTGVDHDDTVLDVACGPGLVACEFAQRAKQVTGVDITPAMIEQAIMRQQQQRLANLSWAIDKAVPLPFPDDSFSVVITRYSFHHLLSPQEALDEMIRVCQPGGTVLVADVSIPADKSTAYDAMELMRDPSHTHALTQIEFEKLFFNSTLIDCRQATYGVEIELEGQLAASFPRPGDKERLRQMIIDDIGINRLGINPRRTGETILYTVPIAVFVGRKA